MTTHHSTRTGLGICLGTLLGLLALPLAAQEQNDTVWVSDSLTTYVRSGPTDGYRIVGTLTAGEPVVRLETSGDYTRVRGPGGDDVWVLSREIQEAPSAQVRLPELEQRVAELDAELDGIDEEWEQRTAALRETLEVREARVAELELRNHELDAEAERSRQAVRELEARLNTQEQDLLMRYFMYGGGVAGAGLLVGLIVPHLPRRRRKRDRWF